MLSCSVFGEMGKEGLVIGVLAAFRALCSMDRNSHRISGSALGSL